MLRKYRILLKDIQNFLAINYWNVSLEILYIAPKIEIKSFKNLMQKKNQHVLTYRLYGNDYRAATLPKSYLIATVIIIESVK